MSTFYQREMRSGGQWRVEGVPLLLFSVWWAELLIQALSFITLAITGVW